MNQSPSTTEQTVTMPTLTSHSTGADSHSLRVAIEGCGHGTLDAIYASVQQACTVKGWDGVDLVIIGGDFQAVRNKHDLNVTAMPHKFRKMADFHHYYSGSKKAPFLTIFIGGNHEASNYLFELYYGGWVAPNIYYLGAANVIQVGPLKIAGMSGIWKAHDYRRPHFERLPYNTSTMRSIYHVRELDTRKLLAYRSQIDIGMSHDWPRHIEFHGNRVRLLRYKGFLRADSDAGKLGSIAAELVMDYLRPAYWFSAHLHAKFQAVKDYNQKDDDTAQGRSIETVNKKKSKQSSPLLDRSAAQTDQTLSRNENSAQHTPIDSEKREKVSAWQTFSETVAITEAEENAKIVQAQKERREERERSGSPADSPVLYETTYKKVKLSSGFGREVTSVSQHQNLQESTSEVSDDMEHVQNIPQLDGCCFSIPVKRRRTSSTGQYNSSLNTIDQSQVSSPFVGRNGGLRYQALSGDDGQDHVRNVLPSSTTDGAASPVVEPQDVVNPDAIDIDLSDEDVDLKYTGGPASAKTDESSTLLKKDGSNSAIEKRESSSNGLRSLPSLSTPVTDVTSEHSIPALYEQSEKSEPVKPSVSQNGSLAYAAVDKERTLAQTSPYDGPNESSPTDTKSEQDPQDVVSEEMRAKLAALSSKFAEPEKVETSPSLPHPETIYNKHTRFLALSKCESNQEFLQLCEIGSLDKEHEIPSQPIKLRYDPEWLAIQRVFASELLLGGTTLDPVPAHRGDTHYRERIIEEEKWVQKNVVEAGLLDIPHNFSITADVYDPEAMVQEKDMPEELTNPQTTAYCELIGIENKFDFSQEDRDARIAAGPDKTDYFDGGHVGRDRRGPRGSFDNRGRGRGGSVRGRGRSGRDRGRGGRGGRY